MKFLGRKRNRLATIVVAVASLLSVGVATAYGANDPPTVEPHIIGGGEASEPYSFMATLGFVDGAGVDTGHQCGATEVFRGWVATVAHCVKDRPADLTAEQQDDLAERYGLAPDAFSHTPSEGTFYVRVGSHDRTSGGETAQVTKIVIHPDFDWFEGAPAVEANDIAMLKLDHELDTQPIQLAGAGDAAKQGDAVRLLGWGITEPDTTGTDPIILQELDTTVGPRGQCGGDGGLTAKELCINNVNGTDGPCFGDSGSPALKKGKDGRWKFVGITSRGNRWCGTTPAIYTDAAKHRKWIYDTARGVEVSAQPVISEPRKSEPVYTLPYEPPNGVQPASQERNGIQPASHQGNCSHCVRLVSQERD